MRFAWSNLSPFEKTVVVVTAFELALFVAVAAVPSVLVGRSYMLYWVFLGPPSLLLAPLVYRLFRYLDEERPIVQRAEGPQSSFEGPGRGEA